jgi:hypothetical protein
VAYAATGVAVGPQRNGGTMLFKVEIEIQMPVCTENLIRVDDVMESPMLAE